MNVHEIIFRNLLSYHKGNCGSYLVLQQKQYYHDSNAKFITLYTSTWQTQPTLINSHKYYVLEALIFIFPETIIKRRTNGIEFYTSILRFIHIIKCFTYSTSKTQTFFTSLIFNSNHQNTSAVFSQLTAKIQNRLWFS